MDGARSDPEVVAVDFVGEWVTCSATGRSKLGYSRQEGVGNRHNCGSGDGRFDSVSSWQHPTRR